MTAKVPMKKRLKTEGEIADDGYGVDEEGAIGGGGGGR
jgi:hypothetical protein